MSSHTLPCRFCDLSSSYSRSCLSRASLPFSVYQTFVLEQKHGFNKTTPALFLTDLLKSWAVGFVIGAPFLAGFLAVFKWAGSRFVPWLMAFLIAASNRLFSASPRSIHCFRGEI